MAERTARRKPIGTLVVAVLAIAAGAVAVGVPLRTIFFAGAVLACPLMMITMMGMGMHGMHRRMNESKPDDQHAASHHSCCDPPRR